MAWCKTDWSQPQRPVCEAARNCALLKNNKSLSSSLIKHFMQKNCTEWETGPVKQRQAENNTSKKRWEGRSVASFWVYPAHFVFPFSSTSRSWDCGTAHYSPFQSNESSGSLVPHAIWAAFKWWRFNIFRFSVYINERKGIFRWVLIFWVAHSDYWNYLHGVHTPETAMSGGDVFSTII